MKVSLKWLQKYLNTKDVIDPQELGWRLTMSTVEVDKIFPLGATLNQVIVGQIKEIVAHPDADLLRVCQVDIGQVNRVTIVCGGTNLRENMFVAVALPGAFVRWHGNGEPVQLAETKIRGISSFGMICASVEIGLAELWPATSEKEIMDLGNDNQIPGTPLTIALDLEDTIYEIDNKSITNRPDLWSHYGLAREVSAIYQYPLIEYLPASIKDGSGSSLKVQVSDSQLCPRYQAAVLSGIKIAPSPIWLQKSLIAVGLKPINNVVDITNYVLADLGQPLHAFDAKKIKGNKINIRPAKSDELFPSLAGDTVKLTVADLVITDQEKVIALAGVMGAANSEVDEMTTDVVLESANFSATPIRRSALRHGLRTEASARFEKNLDPNLTAIALAQAVQMILALCPEAHIISQVFDLNKSKKEKIVIKTTVEYIEKKIGMTLGQATIVDILARLKFVVVAKKNNLQVTVPSWRATKDISREEDLVEEVARIYGYDRIVDSMPSIKITRTEQNKEIITERKIKSFLSRNLALNEVYNYSWQDEKYLTLLKYNPANCLQLKNYLSPDQRFLRPTLLTNLVKNLTDNLRWFKQIGIFEVGRVYWPVDSIILDQPNQNTYLPQQPKMLAWLIYQEEENLFFTIKGQLEYLFKELGLTVEWQIKKQPFLSTNYCLSIVANGEELGYFGLLIPKIAKELKWKNSPAVTELNLTEIAKQVVDKKKYQPLPKYPVVIKDFSVILSASVPWIDLEKSIYQVDPLVIGVELFDQYQDQAGQFSIAFHIRLYDPTKTLTTQDIEAVSNKIKELIEDKYKLTIKK